MYLVYDCGVSAAIDTNTKKDLSHSKTIKKRRDGHFKIRNVEWTILKFCIRHAARMELIWVATTF